MATQTAVISSPPAPETSPPQQSQSARTFDPDTLPGDLESRLDRADVVTLEVSEEQLVDLMRQLRRTEEDIQNLRHDVDKKETSYHIVAGLDVRIGQHLWNDGAHGPQIALYGTADKLSAVNDLLLRTPENQPRWYEQSEKPETNNRESSINQETGEETMAAGRSSKKGGAAVDVEANAASVESNGTAAPAPIAAAIEQPAPAVEQAKTAQTDITSTQIKRQLDAMGNEAFRIAIRDPAKSLNGEEPAKRIIQTLELSAEEVLKKVPYLKMMNVQGNDILIKPIGESNVVMVDGLSREQMNAMHVKEGGPAVALQVTPDTYQAFVKVGNEAIPAQQRREIAKELTERFGGDQQAVTEGHYGRLAGFTNRDPELTKNDSKQPWVKVQSAKGESLDQQQAAELLTSANVRVEEINKLLEQTRNQAIENFRDTKAGPGELNPNSPNADATIAFKTTAARLFERYGEGFDESKADWLIAKDMAQKGWDKKQIAGAIEEGSANIEPRKFDGMQNYANKTAGRAIAVVESERVVDKSKSLDRGVER